MTTLTEKIKGITVAVSLASALGGCLEEVSSEADSPIPPSRTPVNCKRTIDRWSKLSICQLDDRERWIRDAHFPYSGSITDYFKDGKIVVYKEGRQTWEYGSAGILMVDELGNRYQMEMLPR